MADNKPKEIKLRAFNIENPNITQASSGILTLLQKILGKDSSAEERTLQRNEQDADRDLLATYQWQPDNKYLFGMMLGIVPGDNSGEFPKNLLSKNQVTIDDIEIGNGESFVFKDYFYFAINNTNIVTNLSGSFSIERLQTYINWLIEKVRGELIFDFTPVMTVPENIQLKDISSVEFGRVNIPAQTTPDAANIATKMTELTGELMHKVFDNVGGLDDIQGEQLVSAKLVVKFKRKPKDMDKEQYQRLMGALTKQITNDQGITIRTKKGGKFDGSEIKKTKIINVETTSGKRIDEEQLKQEMERFLNELK